MAKSIKSRLEALEASYKGFTASLFTVYYHDGSTRLESAGNCIGLVLTEPDKIDRFEENRHSGNCGCMVGLLNDLLIDADEMKGENNK
jgi:hypothetical protein